MAEERLLFLHAMAPPHRGGTAVVVHRLLGGLDGVALEVVTSRSLRSLVAEGGELVLPARYRYVPRVAGGLAGIRVAAEAIALVNLPLALLAGLRGGLLARRSRARWLVSAVDGGFSQIAGAIAARVAGCAFVLMVFDPWEENAYGRVERRLGRRLERRIQRRADALVVFCEAAADHYRGKHGIEAHVLSIPMSGAARPRDRPRDQREVLVAGSLYWAQEDAVRRLLAAAGKVEGVTVTMLGDPGNLARRGFSPDRVEPPVAEAEFPGRAARAGVLFVGLSFGSAHPMVVRTATPARLAEYMASGRPILVHAPAESHVSRYAREEDFAAVCDVPDEDALAATLRHVLADPSLAAERAARARRLALERHAPETVRASLRALLDRL